MAIDSTWARADLVLRNGRVWTSDPPRLGATAVACAHGRIIAVGSDHELRDRVGPSTRVMDAGGRLILPGFNDAHVHLIDGGAGLSGAALRDATTPAELRDRIRAFAQAIPAGRWMTRGNWDHEQWRPPELPTRALIDDVTAQHPVFVKRIDLHMALANSAALELAGITRETPDPPGGSIVRDARGEPTGVLKDAAMEIVARVIPAPTAEEIEHAVRAAMREAAEHGVTSVHDMSAGPEVIEVYRRLEQRGELSVRVYAFQPLRSWQSLATAGIRRASGSDMLRFGGLKAFADGSLGSTTALFFEPYLDAPDTSGLFSDEIIPEEAMRDAIAGADAADLQIAVHAIGDRANDTVLGMFERIGAMNGPRNRRFRIEHAQHLRPSDVGRFARAGVIASVQPYHAADDGRWLDRRIGPERARQAYAFRSLLDAGATLAFGSDWPVAPLDPIGGIHAAVTRRTLDGRHPDGWVPEQKIFVEEAVRAYTIGSATAEFAESVKGTISEGSLADLVVLSDDILRLDPLAIDTVRVDMTILGGRVIFER